VCSLWWDYFLYGGYWWEFALVITALCASSPICTEMGHYSQVVM